MNCSFFAKRSNNISEFRKKKIKSSSDPRLNPVLESLLLPPGLGTACLEGSFGEVSETPLPGCERGGGGFQTDYEVTLWKLKLQNRQVSFTFAWKGKK